LIEEDKLIIKDFDVISELTTFVSSGGSFAGEAGSNDDLVMTLVMFAWLSGQKYFKELTNNNLRNALLNQTNEVTSRDAPFMIVDNHQEDEPIRADIEPGIDPGDLWLLSDETFNPFDKER
jgi:hypothetical protein